MLAEKIITAKIMGMNLSRAPSIHVEGEDVPITEEMLDVVDTYVSYVMSLTGNKRFETVVKVETADDLEPLWGTADTICVSERERLVEIVDFKYGQGVFVSADTPQFRIYALGVLDFLGPFVEIDNVNLTVVQPRAGDTPIRSVTIPVGELVRWQQDVLVPALRRLKAGDATEAPGEHCRWCVRSGECKTLAKLAMDSAKVAFGEVPPDPTGMTDAEIGAMLQHGEMILAWVNRMRMEASARLDNGGSVPGWKLVAKRAMRRWDDPEGAIIAIKQKQVPLMDVLRIETIGTVEKVLKRYKVPLDTIDPYTIKQSSGSTLVSEADGRPAVDTSAKNVFSETEPLD
jgi:hypothetical protein